MDEFLPPNSCCPPSPASLTAGHHDGVVPFEVLEQWLKDDDGDDVVPFEVLEQWLKDDDDDDDDVVPFELLEQWLKDDDDDTTVWGDGGSSSAAAGNNNEPSPENSSPSPPVARRRGRKPGPRTLGPAVTHVEAERQRRGKLNRRFCELRAAVPTVSRMDRASLLADAARYIAELRGRVEQLEAAKARQRQAVVALASASPTTMTASSCPLAAGGSSRLLLEEEKLEVRMAGPEAAALSLTTAARHAPARLMDALRSLDLPLQHACVSLVGGVTVLDAVVDVPTGAFWDDAGLRAALLHGLQVSAAI